MNGFHLEETYVSCPYDPVHRIRLCKMQFHLTKCAKNFPDVKLETCPYYSSHKFRAENRNEHLDNCEYRQNFDEFLVERKNPEKYEPKIIASKSSHQIESWDDSYSASYNPQKHLENNPIRRKMMVEPKSKKKQFRLEEEIRYRKLLDEMKALNVGEEPLTISNAGVSRAADGTSNDNTKATAAATNQKSNTKKVVGTLSEKDTEEDDAVSDTDTETQSTVTTVTNRTATTTTTIPDSNNCGKQCKMVLSVNFNLENKLATATTAKEPQSSEPKKTIIKKPTASM